MEPMEVDHDLIDQKLLVGLCSWLAARRVRNPGLVPECMGEQAKLVQPKRHVDERDVYKRQGLDGLDMLLKTGCLLYTSRCV